MFREINKLSNGLLRLTYPLPLISFLDRESFTKLVGTCVPTYLNTE